MEEKAEIQMTSNLKTTHSQLYLNSECDQVIDWTIRSQRVG